MPRARRDQENVSRSRHTRGEKLNTTPPRIQNGAIAEDNNRMQAQRSESSNSTTQTTEMRTGGFAPLLLGAGIANSTFVQDVNNVDKNLNNSTTNPPENTTLESGSTLSEQGAVSGLLSTISTERSDSPMVTFNNQIHRLGGFSSLLSQWTKKGEGLPVMDTTLLQPSRIQPYEKYGLSKAVAAAQALSDPAHNNTDENTKLLIDEIAREKASRFLAEQLLEEQRHQYQLLQQDLENTRQAKREGERRVQQYERRITELEITLATAQQALEMYHNSNETSDWVLVRQEIELTNNVIGIGGWGKVIEGRFRGSVVAVKQIHELILSPHNRRLFEREMNIASRCRHPCLLQFIGATNDDDSPLFVSELLDTSLRAVLQERELEPNEVKTIALDVARALNYLHLSHPAPIIHRDISSANVLLWKHGDGWRAKVSDYGTANFMQYSMTISPGAVVYSAPEAQTSRQSPKVDVYSFGVLLCEMNIREFPDVTHRTEQVALVTNHLYRDLIRRCVLEVPEERPSMTEIIDTLNEN